VEAFVVVVSSAAAAPTRAIGSEREGWSVGARANY